VPRFSYIPRPAALVSSNADDPLIALELHTSTIDLFRSLLGALEAMSKGTGAALTAEQQNYLAQAMDIAADLDIVFGELENALVRSAYRNTN
jgi:hypothetical protein